MTEAEVINGEGMEPKKRNTTIIIAVVVVLLLLCCCLFLLGAWFFGDTVVESVEGLSALLTTVL